MLTRSVQRIPLKNIAKKYLSTTDVNNKVAIARNILLLKEISAAKDEEQLNQLLSSDKLPEIDINNLPAELKDFKDYLTLSNINSTDKFTPDSNAWQNKSFGDFAAEEATRRDTFPFIIGIG